MRIIGGAFRGTILASVGAGDSAAHLRPTGDRVRESLFNLLINGGYGNPLDGARVLDLFAGTGALGLEALSRGAAYVTLVENGRPALALIAQNIAKCRADERVTVVRRDATRLGSCAGPHDLVFLDPPYGTDLGARAVASALAGGWIAPGALVVWEDDRPPIPPAGLMQRDQRRYGGTTVTILQRDSDT